MQLVKLGGSLITTKKAVKKKGEKPGKVFRKGNCERAASEIAQSKEREVIIVHGAGSFGHVEAKRYGLHKSYDGSKRKSKGAALVSQDVRKLNLKVMRMLSKQKLYSMSIPPSTTIKNRDGKIASFSPEFYRMYLQQNLIPVSFGDLVLDTSKGISICSGDGIMLELSKVFVPKRAVFVTDVDGVFDKNPFGHDDAKLIEKMTRKRFKDLKQEGVEQGVDVTGGMYRKVQLCLEIKKRGVECVIVNGTKKGRLLAVLKGEKTVGTYF
jgi:isopentenyl phosphate kinase